MQNAGAFQHIYACAPQTFSHLGKYARLKPALNLDLDFFKICLLFFFQSNLSIIFSDLNENTTSCDVQTNGWNRHAYSCLDARWLGNDLFLH